MDRARKAALFAAAFLLASTPPPVFALGKTEAASEPKRNGHPTVVLDRLTLPDVADAAAYKRHLKQVLKREVRRADWGVGKGHRIEYRFRVDDLELTREGSALKVHCSATGMLPRGKAARSRLIYGGDPKKPREVVFRVLEIVARGVVTRLAELERARRAESL